MRIGSLFSGIGGLELGLERAGVGRVAWQVEIDPFCRAVLAKHWPDVERFEDVRSVGASNLSPVDVICGGFPCQDVSLAGLGRGLEGERSGLWFEYLRIVTEMRPRFVVVENVLEKATAGEPSNETSTTQSWRDLACCGASPWVPDGTLLQCVELLHEQRLLQPSELRGASRSRECSPSGCP